MNNDIERLMQNLAEAQNALKENQILLQKKSIRESEMQEAIGYESAAIKKKSERVLSVMDHEFFSIKREYHRKIQSVLTESEKMKVSMNKLTNQLAKIDEIIKKMNRSDAKQEKRIHRASITSLLVDKKYIKPLVYPIGFEQRFIYFGFLFIASVGIAFPIALLVSGFIPTFKNSDFNGVGLIILWMAQMYGYYRLRRHLKNHGNYYLKKTQRHNDEISALNSQMDDILAKIQLSHSDAILMIGEYHQKLQAFDTRIEELNQEKYNKIRTIETKKREMSNWSEISNIELQTRAIENITSEYKKEMEIIDTKINRNHLFLKNECKVGPEYQNEETLAKLISYLRNERASTIKDALELYLKDKRYEEERLASIDYQNKQLQLQKRHFEELSKKLEILAKQEKNNRR